MNQVGYALGFLATWGALRNACNLILCGVRVSRAGKRHPRQIVVLRRGGNSVKESHRESCFPPRGTVHDQVPQFGVAEDLRGRQSYFPAPTIRTSNRSLDRSEEAGIVAPSPEPQEDVHAEQHIESKAGWDVPPGDARVDALVVVDRVPHSVADIASREDNRLLRSECNRG